MTLTIEQILVILGATSFTLTGCISVLFRYLMIAKDKNYIDMIGEKNDQILEERRMNDIRHKELAENKEFLERMLREQQATVLSTVSGIKGEVQILQRNMETGSR